MNDQKNPGLYVHVPFCKTKCPYCDFYSKPSLSLVPDWIDALREETLLYKDRFAQFDTVYLGGGTPSHVIKVSVLYRLHKSGIRDYSILQD